MILSATVFFCLLAILLLWVIIGGKGHWLVKLSLIIPTVAFSLVIGYSLPTMLGWPSKDELPKKYELLAARVENPNLKTGYPGRILIWAVDMEPSADKYKWSLYSPDRESPRVYEIPYSKKMHKRVQAAQKMLKKGRRVMGTNGKKGKSKGKTGHAARHDKKGNIGGGEEGDDSVGPKFYIMPPVKLPQK